MTPYDTCQRVRWGHWITLKGLTLFVHIKEAEFDNNVKIG